MVRVRPSGLKAAPHPLRGRPAAGPDPGASADPGRQQPRARPKGLPPGSARHPNPATAAIVNTETVIYRHRCDDPLNPSGI